MKDIRIFFSRYRQYILGYKFLFSVAILGTLLVAGATSWSTYLVKPVLDDLFVKKDMAMLKVLPFLIVLAYFLKSAGSYMQSYCINFIGQDIVRKLRSRMIEHLLSLELAFFNKMRTGELISRISNDINIIRTSVSGYIADTIRDSLTAIGLIAVVIYQSPKLAVIGLVIMPLSIIPISFLIKGIKRYSKKSQEKNSDITSKLTEIFNNVELIKVSNGEKIESEEFKNQDLAFFKINIKSALVNNAINPLMELLGAMAIGLVIYLGGLEVIYGRMTTGEFFSFMTALFMLYTPIKRLTSNYGAIQNAIVASDRIHEILDREPNIKSGTTNLIPPIKSLKLENVGFYYEDFRALDDVNFTINQNEILAIVGKSGAGKSSLVNLILRLYEPTSGAIVINGININNLTYKSLRDNISIVTQRIFIFNDSIAANVAYGRAIDEGRVIEALKAASAYEFVEELEDGIYTKLDEFGINLSGGQRQRIAIARAIYKDPAILILDEATSALDENTEEIIKEAINNFRKDKIIIIIAHRPSTIKLADKILHLEAGKVVSMEGKRINND